MELVGYSIYNERRKKSTGVTLKFQISEQISVHCLFTNLMFTLDLVILRVRVQELVIKNSLSINFN